MYEELVKRLRERSVFLFPHHGESRSYDADLMHEAADAIEDLQQTVEQMKAMVIVEAQHTEMFDERDKKTLIEMAKSLPLQIIPYNGEKPRWIPVTERLPEKNGYYLTYVESALFPNSYYFNLIKFIDGDFIEDHCVIHRVTHWMPLPTPPKEERK